jgi:uncharacterized protein (UPF0333 family)
MKSEGNALGKIILFSVIFLIVGGVGGYFIGAHSSNGNNNFRYGNGNFSNGNFQLNESVRAEITSFFDNAQNAGEISNYCQANPRYCMEYCRIINPSNEICNTLNITGFRGGMPAR